MIIFLAPHNDDEALFGAYTLMREKPLVLIVTDSYVQGARPGVNITARQRKDESAAACKVLGCQVAFLGLPDTELTAERLIRALDPYRKATKVYAPMMQHGHAHHDLVSDVACQTFANVVYYATYTRGETFTPQGEAVVPTPEEVEIKNTVLKCYTSQLEYPPTRPHFDAVIGRPEYLSHL